MGIHKIIEEIITSALTQRSAFAPSYLLGPIIAMFDIVSEKGRHFDTAKRSFLGHFPVRYESDFGSSTLLKVK